VEITTYELAIILINMIKAMEHPEIGDLHPYDTIHEQTQILSKRFLLPRYAVENGLYYCNMLREVKSFVHPTKGFTGFVGTIERRNKSTFDRDLNLLEKDKT